MELKWLKNLLVSLAEQSISPAAARRLPLGTDRLLAVVSASLRANSVYRSSPWRV